MNISLDYSRPDFARSHRWISLNGVWDFESHNGPLCEDVRRRDALARAVTDDTPMRACLRPRDSRDGGVQ